MSQENSRFASTLNVNGTTYAYYPVSAVAGSEQLPYSLTVLLENVLRNAETPEAAEELAARIVEAGRAGVVGSEIEFSPARVLFQDFTGVPVFVDFAVMREACAQLGGDPTKINPQIPCDLVIDHSVIADVAGCAGALAQNMELEFSRNKERYDFLKWSQESFENVRIVPPGQGICHQLNIEKFASVVMESPAGLTGADGTPVVYFDTLVGTDSHTPTANGIGVLGWGVGGIEAEAAALGQPITTLVPRVIGVRLTGDLSEGVSAMDVSLTFAQMLRERGVEHALVNLGGNVAVMGGKPDGAPWRVGVRRPLPSSSMPLLDSFAVLALRDGSAVTSGIYERAFEQDGKLYHHILDPRTGFPAETDLLSATVVAQSSLDADGYTTALIMMGADRALAFAEQHPAARSRASHHRGRCAGHLRHR